MSSASACFLFPISWGLQKYNYFLNYKNKITNGKIQVQRTARYHHQSK
nr:MAG TPA: hypothetical protein [Caudoviricetes sp.]